VQVDGECHTPATLAPGITQIPSCRRLGGWQDWLDGCGKYHQYCSLIRRLCGPYRISVLTMLWCAGEHGNEPFEVHERLEISGVYE